MTEAAGPVGTLDTALARAHQLLRSNPAMAAEQAREILKVAPGHPPATLLLGVAQRACGDTAGAVEVLGGLTVVQANWAAAHYEFGVALADAGRHDAALAALHRAVALRPQLPDAWRAIGDQLTLKGDTRGADQAYAHHIKASTRDPALLTAASALVEGRIAHAEAHLRSRLKDFPTDVVAIRMLAEVAARLGRNADAEVLLERCLELSPSFAPARQQYAIVLHRLNKSSAALREIDALAALDPRNPAYRSLRAVILVKIGEYGESIALYEEVLKAYPEEPKLWMSYGHTLATAGRHRDSIAAYRKSIEYAPQLGEAYWSLANLKTFRFSDEERRAMRFQLERADLPAVERLHFDFAMGKDLEDQGDYAPSFIHYVRANEQQRARSPYDISEMTDFVKRCKELLSADFFQARAGVGAPDPDPIFIVGLPRAGSTLIEQILASHADVEGTMELPDLTMIVTGLSGRRKTAADSPYPEVLGRVDMGTWRKLGEEYVAQTRIQRKTRKPLFIDKMPNNFLHIGLIAVALPNAKIIDARRHPMGCCFSGFKQHFAEGHRYTYSLDDVGRYYRAYVELMQHFDRVIPGKVHRVIYEALIEDTDAEVRRLLAYCGLPFDSSCLRFYENDRPVRTPSSLQVKQPIYREGVEHWRHYEAWLGPLEQALGDVLSTYPATPHF